MFTTDWSSALNDTLNRLYSRPVTDKMTCLEIGSFEGKGSLMIINKLCSNAESKLVCVDPWEDVYVKDKNEYKNIDHFFVNQYSRFISNTVSTKKIVPVRGYSDNTVPLLTDRFDFVFIDGDHSPEQVYKDAVMSFDKTNIGGIIVFDDYLWVHDGIKCKDGVDRFLKEYSGKIEVLFQNWQVGIRKKFNKDLTYHVYAINWNESRLLPSFFKHYHDASSIFILDNFSDDNSNTIIKENGGIIIPFNTNGTLNDQLNMNAKNNVWKQSRGVADFVIVQDLDEFVFFPDYPNDILAALTILSNENSTFVKFTGYNMLCSDNYFDEVISSKQTLHSMIWNGWIDSKYSKSNLFNPNEVSETNFHPGSHTCNPAGNIRWNTTCGLILHYKHIGYNYVVHRYKAIRNRISESNKKRNEGLEYLLSDFQIEAKFKEIYKHDGKISIFSKLYLPTVAPIIFKQKRCAIDTFGKKDAIGDILLRSLVWEPKVANYISTVCSTNETIFIDVGSNIGYHSCIAKISGAKDVYAFECNPRTFLKLKKTKQLNGFLNFNIFDIGLSDSSKEVPFIEVDGNLGASFITTTHKTTHTSKSGGHFTVKTKAFDELLLNLNTEYKILVKIDVEGHELEALNGMKGLLNNKNVIGVIIELNVTTLPSEAVLHDILDVFNEWNSMLLFDVSIDGWSGHESAETIQYPTITRDQIISMFRRNIMFEVVFTKKVQE